MDKFWRGFNLAIGQNAILGGDLIWRMQDFDKFGEDSPNSPNLIPAKINPLKVSNFLSSEQLKINSLSEVSIALNFQILIPNNPNISYRGDSS